MKNITRYIYLFALLILTGCNSSGDGFSGLEDTVTEEAPGTSEIAVLIDNVSPITDPVILKSTENKTFGVSVNSGSGSVSYNFSLDGGTVQNTTSSFYELDASTITVGSHTLIVTATNTLGSDSHTFNIIKNTAPLIAFDSQTATTITCGVGTFTLEVTASDADGDTITFSYLLAGLANPTFLMGTSGASSASVVFSPSCALSGANNITIRATDTHGEYTNYTVPVTVNNPNVASIDSFNPTTSPTVILSSSNEDFSISASGNPPITYVWAITPGSTIATCTTPSCTIAGTDFTPGSYTVTGTVNDSVPSTDSHSFNIVLNQKPQISSATPSNIETTKMNCASSKSFSLNVTDANFGDASQTHTVSWLVDGLANAALNSIDTLGISPMISNATFSPGCASSLLGNHTISAVFSDGHESVTTTWNLNVNYFSDSCNSLTAGQICTVSGFHGMGSGLSTVTDNDKIRIRPNEILDHPTGGFFISDTYWDVVWFYNNTASSMTVINQTIPANTLQVIAGTGAWGRGTDGQSSLNFYLRDPEGLAFDSVTGDLYVASYSDHRIIKFTSAGVGSRFAGGGSSNTDGATRITTKCNNPARLVLDEANNKLFSSCYGNTGGSDGAVKYFRTDVDQAYTLIRYQGNTSTEGTTNSYAGTARMPRAYAIAKHPGKDIIYATDLQHCRMHAISYGDTESYYNGAEVLTANTMQRLTLNTGCGNTVDREYTNTGGRLRPYGIAPYVSGGVLKGIFMSLYNNHSVVYLNTTATDQTFGGRTITSGYYHRIFGTGSSDYARGTPTYTSSYVSLPRGVRIKGDTLYIADYNNFKVGTLDISTTNGAAGDLVGNLRTYTYDSESSKHANERQYYYPSALAFDATNNSVLIMDWGNRRIRSMSLANGSVTTVAGRGNGNSNTNPEDPLLAYMQTPRDLTVGDNGNMIMYSDSNTGAGTNRNCLVRVLNRSGSDQTYFNQLIPNNRVSTVGGNYVNGCNTWSAGYEGNAATSARFYEPFGIAPLDDLSAYYVVNRRQHCIQKVTSAGTIATEMGTCGTTGNVNGAFASTKFTYPGDLELDSNLTNRASGNFFVVDRAVTTNSYIKYANFTGSDVDIASITVSDQQLTTVISTDGYTGGVASFEDQICYSQGSTAQGSQYGHNVICVDRVSGITTLRVGKSTASVVKGKAPLYQEQEGISAGSATLNSPWGVTFDAEGNLYISCYYSNTIRMVKKWW